MNIATDPRKSGETQHVVWEQDFGQEVDLAGKPVKFFGWRRVHGRNVMVLDGVAAVAVDVSDLENPDQVAKQVWQLIWVPEPDDVSYEKEVVLYGEFEVDYGGSTGKRYYPPGEDNLAMRIFPRETPASEVEEPEQP